MKNLALALLACLIASCASTKFTPYEGGKVLTGNGGAKDTVDGIDIWTLGTPPRKYRVVGVLDDKRRDAPIGMIGYKGDLAEEAKKHGGDAVIILSEKSEFKGYYTPPSTSTSTTTGTARTTGSATSYGGYTSFNANTGFRANTTHHHGATSTYAISDKITQAVVIEYID